MIKYLIYLNFLLFFSGFMGCDPLGGLTPSYEYKNISRDRALKFFADIPSGADNIFIKRSSSIDSTIIYVRYEYPSDKGVREIIRDLKSKGFIRAQSLPENWPSHDSMPFSSKPHWWQVKNSQIYYKDYFIGRDKEAVDTSSGRALFINKNNEISIWYWSIQWWGVSGN